MSSNELSIKELPQIPFSLCGLCCPKLEPWLYKHRCMAIFLGCLLYLPLLFILEIAWFASIILTIIINLLIITLCCNWIPLRKLFNIPPPRDKQKYGVMLQTAPNKELTDNIVESDAERLKSENKTEISILQFNAFTYCDRFWQRYPLLIRLFSQHQADIICIQECITTNWWQFGTLQTLKRINSTYNGFSISVRESFMHYQTILFRYNFLWSIISELQLILQTFFGFPFWLDLIWQATLGGNWIARYGYLMLSGTATHFGNAIAFRNDKQLKYKSFIALPGDRNAIRCLYDLTHENGKKIWIVCTHFSCEEEQQSFYADKPPAVAPSDEKKDEQDVGDVEDVDDTESMGIGMRQAKMLMDWIDDGNKNVIQADYVIVCGDFNANEKTEVYRFMGENGFKSVMFEKEGYEKKTFASGTWTANNLMLEGVLTTTYDYIWVKNCHGFSDDDFDVEISKCKLVGEEYVAVGGDGGDVEGYHIHASDHLGIYAKISL